MQITILGSGTGLPSTRRAAPGILVETTANCFLFDSGPGVLRQLERIGLSTHNITHLCYTHLHQDHTLDLVTFLFCARFHIVGSRNLTGAVRRFIRSKKIAAREDPLHLIGPKGFRKFFRQTMSIYKWIRPKGYPFTLKEITEQTLRFKSDRLKSIPVKHERNSVAYRLEDARGRSVVYSGDTGYCRNIVRLATNVDVLILECSFPDAIPFPLHLHPRLIGRIAREARPKRVILTHIYPVSESYDLVSQVRKVWKGRVSLAADLMRIKL